MRKKFFYKLIHKRIVEFFDNDPVYDTKLLGFFSTYKKAEKAIEKYRNVSGFKESPDGFFIEKIEIDSCDF